MSGKLRVGLAALGASDRSRLDRHEGTRSRRAQSHCIDSCFGPVHSIHCLCRSKGGKDDFIAVGEGLIEVTGSWVGIATDMAIESENIDDAVIEEARHEPPLAPGRSFPPIKSHQ
jgi:hypothetical protein